MRINKLKILTTKPQLEDKCTSVDFQASHSIRKILLFEDCLNNVSWLLRFIPVIMPSFHQQFLKYGATAMNVQIFQILTKKSGKDLAVTQKSTTFASANQR